MKGDEPLYVGSSEKGIARVVSTNDQSQPMTRAVAEKIADRVAIYRTDDIEHMKLLEVKLMFELQAEFNQCQIKRTRKLNGVKIR